MNIRIALRINGSLVWDVPVAVNHGERVVLDQRVDLDFKPAITLSTLAEEVQDGQSPAARPPAGSKRDETMEGSAP